MLAFCIWFGLKFTAKLSRCPKLLLSHEWQTSFPSSPSFRIQFLLFLIRINDYSFSLWAKKKSGNHNRTRPGKGVWAAIKNATFTACPLVTVNCTGLAVFMPLPLTFFFFRDLWGHRKKRRVLLLEQRSLAITSFLTRMWACAKDWRQRDLIRFLLLMLTRMINYLTAKLIMTAHFMCTPRSVGNRHRWNESV